jgi:anti-sigma regulatory factor (Ser/Thr protein kinase)
VAERPRTHDSYRHEALLWRGLEDFLAGTVPFIEEGLAAGEPVMAAVVPERLAALEDALGAHAARVRFVDMTQLGQNPARILPAWQRFAREHAVDGQAVRGIGEPIWSGRRPAEVVECQLHEALLNVAVEPDVPLWLLCPYDVQRLPAEVVTEAHRSHEVIVEVEHHRHSALYGGAHNAARMFQADLPLVDVAVSHRVFAAADELRAVRKDVTAHALGAGLSAAAAADVALAVHEVAINSLTHGGGRGELRIWREDDALICEVHDDGRIADPMVGRRAPSWGEESGRGLWMANQLCDLVQVRSGQGGTTVRIHSWL